MAKQFVPLFSAEEIADVAALYAAAADDYSEVRLGETVFFWQKLTKVRYAPLRSIVWAYIRQEDSRMTLCCGKGIYNSYFLMLMDANGKRVKIPIEMEQNIRSVLRALEERCPAITIGYSEQNAARFMTPANIR